MDYQTVNFSTFRFKAQKLEAASAKTAVGKYKQATKDYLKALCKIDSDILAQIRKILLDTDSYEVTTIDVALSVNPLLANIDKTGDLPLHRINSIADLIDEGKVNLYPLNQLSETTRKELDQLCEVVSLYHAVTSKHTETDLVDLYHAWAQIPPKGKVSSMVE